MKANWIIALFIVSLALADSYTYSDLSEARYYLAAAGGGGKILFGYGDNGTYSNRIDIYDVASSTWSYVNQGKSRHGLAAVYADGLILFGGGFNGSIIADVDIYNVSSGTFSSSSLSEARSRLAAAGTGQRILFGGGDTSTTGPSIVVDIYFTNNNTWGVSSFKSTIKRYRHAAAAAGGDILFAGGDDYANYRAEVDIYNTQTDEWEAVKYLSQPRNNLAGAGAGDLAIFAGGYSLGFSDVVDIFNVTAGTQSTAALSAGRTFIAGAAVDLGKGLFFFGGGYSGTISDHLDIYDAELDAWHYAKLEVARRDLAAASSGNTAIFGGGLKGTNRNEAEIFEMSSNCRARSATAATAGDSVYFLGGEGGGPNGTISYARADVFDSNLEELSKFGLNLARKDAAAASAGGYLLVGGGRTTGTGAVSDNVEVVKLSNGSHASLSLNTARSNLAAAGKGALVVFAGGFPTSSDVDIFDVVTGVHTVDSLSVARYGLAAASLDAFVGSYIFLAGGWNGTHAFDTLDILDTNSLTWGDHFIAEARYNLAGVTTGTKVFFAGGENGTYYSTMVDSFDGDTLLDSTMSLAVARSQLAAVAPKSGEYVAFAGGIGDTGALDSVEIYWLSIGVWSYEVLSVASYKLSGGALGDKIVVMAGKTDDGTWSSCTVDTILAVEPVPSSSFSSLSSLSSSSTISSSSLEVSSSTSSGASSATSGVSSASLSSSIQISSSISSATSGTNVFTPHLATLVVAIIGMVLV